MLVSLYWALAVVPSAYNIRSNGRAPWAVWGISYIEPTAAGHRITILLVGALLATSGLIVAIYARGHHESPFGIGLVVALSITLQLSTYGGSGHFAITPATFVTPAVAIAIFVLHPPRSSLKALGVLTVALALASLVYGAISESAWMYGTLRTGIDTKAVVGTGLLAGPFGHMNNLGMSMVMGIPFISMIAHSKLRWVGFALTATALLLSASRMSFIALAAMAALYVAFRFVPSSAHRILHLIACTLLAIVAFVLPLLVRDPTAFTARGLIWIVSRAHWTDNVALGLGVNAFSADSVISDEIGAVPTAAHNVLLHYLVVGGLIGAALVVVLMVNVIRRAAQNLPHDRTLSYFVVCVLCLSIAEMPFRFESTLGQMWIAWPALMAVVGAEMDRKTQRTSQLDTIHDPSAS